MIKVQNALFLLILVVIVLIVILTIKDKNYEGEINGYKKSIKEYELKINTLDKKLDSLKLISEELNNHYLNLSKSYTIVKQDLKKTKQKYEILRKTKPTPYSPPQIDSVLTALYTQDSTPKVPIGTVHTWNLIHDAQSLRSCEIVVNKQDSTLKLADSLLVVGGQKVANLENQVAIHEQKDQDQEAEAIVVDSYYKSKENQKNKTITKLGAIGLLELVIIIILL